MTDLFSPFVLQGVPLANRAVMAPMTRARSPDGIPSALTATYYAQRAGAGLIVTEGTAISLESTGFLFIPGIYTPAHVEGWRKVTSAVHAAGGKIFMQLWHVGRCSHVSLQENGKAPVSSTDQLPSEGFAFAWVEPGKPGMVPTSPPRRLETGEITRLIGDFADAATRAIEAGFDGVEFHGGNGYLFEQFLNPGVNDRADLYGAGTMQDRLRFILETVDAVVARIGAARVGVRLSPFSTLGGVPEYPEAEETYLQLGQQLGARGIAYIHVIDQSAHRLRPAKVPLTEKLIALMRDWRPHLRGTALILAGNQTLESANRLIGDGTIDLAAFGQPFIANPDLVTRLRDGVALAEADPASYYGGGAKGYTDWPRAGEVPPQ